ncbi:MAG TPA: cytochrome C [Anaeromyxobacteraceae bacterium]|nr:cytochrome C [Anaeromyxobacteraceae bacterium]
MEHARHVFRAALVLAVATAVVFLGRSLLVPRSYGDYGPYRADNVAEQARVRAPRHGGPASCAGCHAKQAEVRAAGSHKTVSCEVCHAPLAVHVDGTAVKGKMPVDRSFTLCARCHRRIAGRPEKFKQVVLEQHVQGPLESGACLECHDPHSPKL